MLGVHFIALGLSGWQITRTIITPLQFLVSACKEFADGDFRDKPRNVVREDEFGQLGDALVSMRNDLRTVFKRVKSQPSR